MKKLIGTLAVVVVLAAFSLLVVSGCGDGGSVDLAFDSSPDNAVVLLETSQAIAPIYNPDAPVAITYGDGTHIQKKGPYEFMEGELSGGVESQLDKLDELGFFKLKESYEGEPLAGGTTDTLTVNLSDKSYTVTVIGSYGPPNWDEIKTAVTEPAVTGEKEYMPEGITLFAKQADGPEGQVEEWPGNPEDLSEAAASSDGVRLEGEEAATAWKAVSDSMAAGGDMVFKAGDSYYTYVYASPMFPGVSQ